MRSWIWVLPLKPTTILVWAAMILTGLGAFLTSGMAVVGALVVLTVLLSTASPQGALYATCAAIPLVFRPIDIASLQLGLLEIGILATAAGTALRLLFDMVEGKAEPRTAWVGTKAFWAFPALLLIVGTLSLVYMPFGSHFPEAVRTWRWVVFEPLLILVLARMAIARDGSAPLTIAIVLPASVVALTAIWQIGWSGSSFAVDDVQRSTATYLHPNNLALYLERAVMLTIFPALLLRSRLRGTLAILSAILLLGLATTFSRGALIGLSAGFGLVLLAHPVRNGWKILGVGSLGSVAVFALLAGTRLSGSGSSGYLETRRYLWDGAIRMLRDFPISGIGLDQFLWLNQSRYIEPMIWSERYASHPHNLLLDSWLSLGMPGLTLLGAFTLALGLLVWKARTGRTYLNPWQLGAIGCLGAGLGHGLVDNGYFLADLSALTWLAIASLTGAPTGSAQGDHD